MDGAAEDDRYNVQNVEQPVRVLVGDLVARNRVVEVRGSRLSAMRWVLALLAVTESAGAHSYYSS